jgi:hypothetical protein
VLDELGVSQEVAARIVEAVQGVVEARESAWQEVVGQAPATIQVGELRVDGPGDETLPGLVAPEPRALGQGDGVPGALTGPDEHVIDAEIVEGRRAEGGS